MSKPVSTVVPDRSTDGIIKLERILLKDQGYQLLREKIISGVFPSGTKLVEREVAQMLGISRAPARDALIQLERDGLVVSKRDARYVIELSELDIREQWQVRLALEQLAVKLAAAHTAPNHKASLERSLQEMENAVANDDPVAFGQGDRNMHRLIWEQAQNAYLLKTLHTMLGPIFMLIANRAARIDYAKTLPNNRELVAAINAGNEDRAIESIGQHLDDALERILQS